MLDKSLEKYDVILVGGNIATGKSWALTRFFGHRVCVSKDSVRRLIASTVHLDYLFDKSFEDIVVQTERDIIKRALDQDLKVAVESLFYNKNQRKFYADLAKRLGKKIAVVFLEADLDKLIERDRNRRICIGEDAIKRVDLSFEKPSLDEGFDRIIVLSTNGFEKRDHIFSKYVVVSAIKKDDMSLKEKSGEFSIDREVKIQPAVKFTKKGQEDCYAIAKIYGDKGEKLKKVKEILGVYGGAIEHGWTGLEKKEVVWCFRDKEARDNWLREIKRL